ncbi:hypothetical protein ALC57_09591 [Trachymyrmex cornetzi]|uniref:Mos1 transposase HTH domain-containing protein n=1 Tax=Trachymyrmex cornetzi TaxID=471704 RepID=A0A195DYY6_9HYME|nr:hypothetical protein ALC57_09591 [Trachymyrmex cornetzi]
MKKLYYTIYRARRFLLKTIEQRICLKFGVTNKISFTHAFKMLQKAYGDDCNILNAFVNDNYKKIVAEMISAFHAMKVNMSLKIHFLHNHLNFFPPNLMMNAFTKTIAIIEKRFKGKDIRHMLGEYCWSIVHDTKPES